MGKKKHKNNVVSDRKEQPLVSQEEQNKKQILEELERQRSLVESAVIPVKKSDPLERITFYPFAYALSENFIDKACWYCLKVGNKVNPCDSCKIGLFCSEECLQLGQKDHKAECKGLGHIKAIKEVPDVEVRLLGRICYRYNLIKKGEDKKIENFYLDRTSNRNVMEIWAHEENFAESQDYTQQFEEIYSKLTHFYSKKDLPSKTDVFKLHCRDFVNRHAISDKNYLNEIGKGLYLDLCAYDHSCAPDTVFYSIGFKSVLVGLRPGRDISNNKTSFYSYIDLLGTFDQRQKQLRDTWFFDCKCERCCNPQDHILTSINCQFCANIGKQSIIIVQGVKAPKKGSRLECPSCKKVQEQFHVMESNYTMRDIDLFLNNIGNVPEKDLPQHFDFYKQKSNYCLTRPNVYRTRLILQYVHFVNIAPEEKADLMASVEPCLRHCFPVNHPGLAFYLRDVASFCEEAEYYQNSIDYATEALKYFEEVFVDHAVITEIRTILPHLQKKAAWQRLKGIKTGLKTVVHHVEENSDSDLPALTPLESTKSTKESAKDKAHHRRPHRAPTPCSLEPVEEQK